MRPANIPRLLAALILCGGVATSCGSPSGSSSSVQGSDASLDACRLLTTSEASGVLGKAVDAGTPAEAVSKGCNWSASSSVGDLDLSLLSILVMDRVVFDGTRRAGDVNGVRLEPANGIGDDAYFQVSGGLVLLNVRRRDVYLSISVTNQSMTPDQIKAAERAAALNALPRI